MSRFKAFAIHFSISFVIFLILLYFILVQWYPQPLFSTDGGWRITQIIVGVDLVLGPLLTLIVFKAGKAGLKFDLTIIALLQISALTWGIFNIINQHPAAIIYTVDHFTPVSANQLTKIGITKDKLQKYGKEYPIIIYSNIPKEKEHDALLKSLRNQTPLYLFSEYYTKFNRNNVKVLLKNSMHLDEYVEDKPKLKQLYLHALFRNSSKINIAYIPLHSREKWVTGIFDLNSMRIIDTIDINPYKYADAQYKKKIENRKE